MQLSPYKLHHASICNGIVHTYFSQKVVSNVSSFTTSDWINKFFYKVQAKTSTKLFVLLVLSSYSLTRKQENPT